MEFFSLGSLLLSYCKGNTKTFKQTQSLCYESKEVWIAKVVRKIVFKRISSPLMMVCLNIVFFCKDSYQ